MIFWQDAILFLSTSNLSMWHALEERAEHRFLNTRLPNGVHTGQAGRDFFFFFFFCLLAHARLLQLKSISGSNIMNPAWALFFTCLYSDMWKTWYHRDLVRHKPKWFLVLDQFSNIDTFHTSLPNPSLRLVKLWPGLTCSARSINFFT